MRSRSLEAVVLVALALALGYGVWRLFVLRYAAGDVYPPYSSLRSDPLGAKALHDALAEIDGLSVRRNTRPIGRLWDEPGATILLLGVPYQAFEARILDDEAEIEALVRHGARALIAFAPVTEAARESEDGKKQKESGPAEPESGADAPRRVPITRRWGFQMTRVARPAAETDGSLEVTARRAGLPSKLSWRSALSFEGLDKAWRVIYARDGRPVLIERDLGRGSLVLAGDAYFASNEALSKEPLAPLVSWIVGPRRLVVFDETHLGVVERPGIATLMRRYRLHAFFASVLLLGALFVWRASSSFPPRLEHGPAGAEEVVTGRDAAAGLITLLRRGIPRRDILRVCCEEWRQSFGHRRPDQAAALEQGMTVPGDPVEGYRRISRTLLEMRIDHGR